MLILFCACSLLFPNVLVADTTRALQGSASAACDRNTTSINLMWTLVAGFLVMFMQAGFALVETGLCRAKNAVHVIGMNLMIYVLGILGFWMCGFAIMFGGIQSGPSAIGSEPTLGAGICLLNVEHALHIGNYVFGLMGGKGFFLDASLMVPAVMALFLFQTVFMDTAATIPTGAMAERWNFKNFMLYGFWVSMLPYAFYGNWVWGGGWLAQLGVNFGLGHGHVDFAGSSVVHMCGGMIALAGAMVLGPRLVKYGKDGKLRAIPAHNIPMVVLGTIILAFGWFGFNAGSTLAGSDNRIAIIAANTMLASAVGAIVTSLIVWRMFGKPDISMICNGLLAGLVAITAPCAFVSPLGAVLIGAIAGGLVIVGVLFFERVLRVDDPVGAISVHGICGAFGVLAVGLFANGSYGAGWGGVHKLFKGGELITVINNGTKETIAAYNKLIEAGYVDQGVTGLFGKAFGASCNDASQLGAQLIGALTCFVFIFGFATLWFKISNIFVPIRSKPENEVAGLDVREMGAEAYPDFQRTDRSSANY